MLLHSPSKLRFPSPWRHLRCASRRFCLPRTCRRPSPCAQCKMPLSLQAVRQHLLHLRSGRTHTRCASFCTSQQALLFIALGPTWPDQHAVWAGGVRRQHAAFLPDTAARLEVCKVVGSGHRHTTHRHTRVWTRLALTHRNIAQGRALGTGTPRTHTHTHTRTRLQCLCHWAWSTNWSQCAPPAAFLSRPGMTTATDGLR